jgi:hypothetical protein
MLATDVSPAAVKALIRSFGLTGRYVASNARLGETQLSKYLGGKSRLNEDQLKRLLAALRRELGADVVKELLS